MALSTWPCTHISTENPEPAERGEKPGTIAQS